MSTKVSTGKDIYFIYFSIYIYLFLRCLRLNFLINRVKISKLTKKKKFIFIIVKLSEGRSSLKLKIKS